MVIKILNTKRKFIIFNIENQKKYKKEYMRKVSGKGKNQCYEILIVGNLNAHLILYGIVKRVI